MNQPNHMSPLRSLSRDGPASIPRMKFLLNEWLATLLRKIQMCVAILAIAQGTCCSQLASGCSGSLPDSLYSGSHALCQAVDGVISLPTSSNTTLTKQFEIQDRIFCRRRGRLTPCPGKRLPSACAGIGFCSGSL